jgi:hypothetical protein
LIWTRIPPNLTLYLCNNKIAAFTAKFKSGGQERPPHTRGGRGTPVFH